MHYWVNSITYIKQKGTLTVMTIEEEEEVVVWCREIDGMSHMLELIQIKSNIA